jgi:DNA-binding HxlR family transcriptional regulator
MVDPRHPHQVIELLAGRWTLGVLAQLGDGGRRYQELHDALDGISHKVLTDTLRRPSETA